MPLSPSSARPASPTPLTDSQKAALDTLQAKALHDSITLDREDGDVQFINNLSILHSREAFAAGTGRHIMRLFWRDPVRAWDKPQHHKLKFEERYGYRQLPDTDFDPSGFTANPELAAHG
ncbi:hypothetical protein FGG08_004943 [Glutinoglossum americanum]|uniref:TauD/TfdA-like domain-containing protein n=1 Tax=Glutinoglossum americanum TaxID=1670608 RepID=A0A9P8I4K4_9PEZI|nr:hypothetical protein FGG08_004943 [Glutinoglossum americanum]